MNNLNITLRKITLSIFTLGSPIGNTGINGYMYETNVLTYNGKISR